MINRKTVSVELLISYPLCSNLHFLAQELVGYLSLMYMALSFSGIILTQVISFLTVVSSAFIFLLSFSLCLSLFLSIQPHWRNNSSNYCCPQLICCRFSLPLPCLCGSLPAGRGMKTASKQNC